MKNPFKNLREKAKELREKMKAEDRPKDLPKTGRAKRIIDGIGDSACIGGLALLGAAPLTPIGTGPALIAGGIFIAVGGTAKFVASKMKDPGPDIATAAPSPVPPAPEETPPVLKAKPAGIDFSRVLGKGHKGNAAAPDAAKKPPQIPPSGPRQPG